MDTAIGLVFVCGGVITLSLYAMIVWCAPASAMSIETTWGYLGRYGTNVKVMWLAGTTVTASAVLTVFWWLVYESTQLGPVSLSGAIIFMSGAVCWPIGVLSGSMRLAQVGVALAASGSIMLLVDVATHSAPTIVIVAGSVMVFHHVVIDGLWAVLTPPGAAQLAESLL